MRLAPNMPFAPGVTPSPVGDGTVQGFRPQEHFALPKDDICRALTCCGDDDPIANWTSDTAPFHVYISVDFGDPFSNDAIYPKQGDRWTSFNCVGGYVSSISQDDADAMASAAMQACIGGNWTDPSGTPIGLIWNEEVVCAIACNDGGWFYHAYPAGRIAATSQDLANQTALEQCTWQADPLKFCLNGPLASGCKDTAYSDYLTISPHTSGMSAYVVSGSLPAGIAMGAIQSDGKIYFTGIPTASGISTFVVQVIDASGNYCLTSYSITVLEITTTDLPDGNLGVLYSFQLQAVGGSGNYVWTIVSGTLLDGLSMDAAGLITGTPTVSGSVDIEFQVSDLG